MNEGTFWIIVILSNLVLAVICALVATNKNRSGLGYFFCGLFFGVIALIVVAIIPKQKEYGELKKCAYCLSDIPARAKRCKYCGADLDAKGTTNISEGDEVIIRRDVTIENQLAFKQGEKVKVEHVDPETERPENKYVVFSETLGERFRLSKWDINW